MYCTVLCGDCPCIVQYYVVIVHVLYSTIWWLSMYCTVLCWI